MPFERNTLVTSGKDNTVREKRLGKVAEHRHNSQTQVKVWQLEEQFAQIKAQVELALVDCLAAHPAAGNCLLAGNANGTALLDLERVCIAHGRREDMFRCRCHLQRSAANASWHWDGHRTVVHVR